MADDTMDVEVDDEELYALEELEAPIEAIDIESVARAAQDMVRALSLIVFESPCPNYKACNEDKRARLLHLVEFLQLNPDASLEKVYSVYTGTELDELSDGQQAEAMMLKVAISIRLDLGA